MYVWTYVRMLSIQVVLSERSVCMCDSVSVTVCLLHYLVTLLYGLAYYVYALVHSGGSFCVVHTVHT